jgi:hypothetical protein
VGTARLRLPLPCSMPFFSLQRLHRSLPGRNRCGESGEGTLERALRVDRWCLYRRSKFLVLCSQRIFGLGRKSAVNRGFRVGEDVGIGDADHPPAPAVGVPSSPVRRIVLLGDT